MRKRMFDHFVDLIFDERLAKMSIVTLLTAAFFFCGAVLIFGFVFFRLDNIR